MSDRMVKNPSGYTSKGRTPQDKAANFGQYLKPLGWLGKWSTDEETGVVHLFARRGEAETLDIWWQANGACIQEQLPIYTLAGERIKLRNVSAAAKIAAAEPDTSRLRKAVRKKNRSIENGNPVVVPLTDRFEGMTDDEIEKALLGKTIAWVNSISGELDSAEVLGRKTIKVYRNGRDQIHFTDYSGFHAVYLNAIVSVS